MRPRPLREIGSVERATAFTDLTVSAAEVFRQARQAPTITDLALSSAKMAVSETDQLNRKARRDVRKNKITLNKINSLQEDLYFEKDETRRDQIRLELEELQKQEKVALDPQVRQMIDVSKLMSVEELNDEFGDTLTFEEPTSREVAEMLYKNKREEIVRDVIINKGLRGTKSYAALLAGSLAGIATDPIELTVSFIPYFGQARRAAAVARFGSIRGRAAIGAAEGLTGSLLTEPAYYALSKQQKLDYSMGEALLNIGAGSLLGGGLGTIAGGFNRASIKVKDLLEITDPKIKSLIPEDIQSRSANDLLDGEKTRKAALENFNILGGKPVADAILGQFINDNSIDVSSIVPKVVPKPVDLEQFVRDSGGLRLSKESFVNAVKKEKVSNKKAARKTADRLSNVGGFNSSGSTVRAMVRKAYNAGYLESRSTKEFLDKLQESASGRFVFAKQDAKKAAKWKASAQATDDFKTDLAHKQNIKEQLEDLSGRTATEQEVNVVADAMSRRNISVEEAAKDIQMKLYDEQAKRLAAHGANINSDVGADVVASQNIQEELPLIKDEFDLDADIELSAAVLRQLEENGELTKADKAEMLLVQQSDEAFDAYVELVREAAVCLRS